MHDYSSLEIHIVPTDDEDYVLYPLKELQQHGWRWIETCKVFGFEIGTETNQEWTVKKGSTDHLLESLREFQQLQWMCGTHLFWQDTHICVEIHFRPEGQISIDIKKAIDLPDNTNDLDWFIANLISPLEKSKNVEFLHYYHLSPDTVIDDNDDWVEISESHFIKKCDELSNLTLAIREIDSTTLGLVSSSGTAKLVTNEQKDRGSINFYKHDDKANIHLVFDIDTFTKKSDKIRNLLNELINTIPKSRKMSDGPCPMLQQHSIEIEMHLPPLDTVSKILQQMLSELFDLEKDDKVLFLYN